MVKFCPLIKEECLKIKCEWWNTMCNECYIKSIVMTIPTRDDIQYIVRRD